MDDAIRPLPQTPGREARRAFGLASAPPGLPERATVWRCNEGRVLACFVGANLPCSKLDTRVAIPSIEAWCAGHPGAGVPSVVSGHDSLSRWRCAKKNALHDGQAWHLDGRGFGQEL